MSARDYQSEADAFLQSLTAGLEPEEAARGLAILAHRTVTRLHNLSRSESTARKKQPDWPAWAQLQNASRTLILQASTCRDLALRLVARHP